MIDLKFEKEKSLSTQDAYDIISFAVDAADDGGFINSFILERAIYEYAVIMFNQDKRDELAPMVAKNINSAWDYMLENGLIDELVNEHEQEVSYIAANAETWAKEYCEYAHSARGIMDTVQSVTGKLSDNMLSKFNEKINDTDIKSVLDIANNWGMNNVAPSTDMKVLSVEDGGLDDSRTDGSLFKH